MGVWEKQNDLKGHPVFQLRRCAFLFSPLSPTTKPSEPPSCPSSTLPSALVNRPIANHVICDFPPFGLHLVCAQMYLSSEKGSNQLANVRAVSPSLWFCLTGPGTVTYRALGAPSRACPWGGDLLAAHPRFPNFFLGLAARFFLREFQVWYSGFSLTSERYPNPRNVFSILITSLYLSGSPS